MNKTKSTITGSLLAARTQPTPSLSHRPLVAAIALSLSLSVANAQAANIWVDSISDSDPGVCRLRDAIIAANTDTPIEGCTAGSGADVIRLVGIAGDTIILNGSPLPTVTSEVSIQGESVTIDGNGASRLMHVDGASASLGISYLSLVGGSASGSVAPANSGGAIRAGNNASLELVSSTVSGNTAVGGGGGIFLENATLTLVNSTLSDNSAGSNGGGIELGSLSTATLMNSTLSGNSASAKGGGIYVGGPFGGYGTSLFLTNSTLSGNSAGGSAPAGGGIFVVYGQTLQLTNSVIANSTGGDCSTSVAATGYGVNLIEDGSCLTAGPNLLTGDPLLGPLSSNGGPTMTHAVLNGSPLVDAYADDCFIESGGINDPGLLGDQRGYQRTDGNCDLGAYEKDGAAGQTGPDFEVNTSADPSLRVLEIIEDPPNPDIRIPRRVDNGDGICSLPPGDCTLREAVVAANRSADASVIRFAAALTAPPVTVRLAGTQLPTVTSDITIQGEGVLVNARQNEIENFRSRIFEIDGASLSIDSLDLTLGNGTTGGVDPQGNTGGAIRVRNGGSLALSNSTLSSNGAKYSGGAIYAGTGSLVSLNGATMTNNFTDFDGDPVCKPPLTTYACGGGAITVVNGTTNLTNSSLNLNTTSGVYGPGGAMHIEGGELSISSSTLSGNSTLVFGGGVWMEGTSFTITNSTFSGNDGNSGALFAGPGSAGQLIQSTIQGSPAEISVQIYNASVNFTNSILANALYVDCTSTGSTITTNGVNLIEDGGGDCGLAPGPALLAVDPMLGPLASNGGPTLTHLPQSGSPVINAGDNAALDAAIPGGLPYDQRGAGYPRFFEINVDLGSVEWAPWIFRDGFEVGGD